MQRGSALKNAGIQIIKKTKKQTAIVPKITVNILSLEESLRLSQLLQIPGNQRTTVENLEIHLLKLKNK
jgi:hypothetical protein